MLRFFCLLLLSARAFISIAQSLPLIPFESDANTSSTYSQLIDFYTHLDSISPFIKMDSAGMSDIGKPIHTIVIADNEDFIPARNTAAKKAIVFINNGIHPGEPDGIDASQLLVKEILSSQTALEMLKKVTIVIIPIYNVGGMLNRRTFTRANQNGPVECGFRGNAKNLDLNRDFMKCDSKNSLTFNTIFSYWDPDVFIDTHVSNGADYQHTMTLIATHHQKLQKPMDEELTQNILPYLYTSMQQKGWPMTPYVNSEQGLSQGINGFMDHPRYSTGYAALHHCYGFMSETHMLKPYKERVDATLDFLKIAIQYTVENKDRLRYSRQLSKAQASTTTSFPILFELDKSVQDSTLFLGYEEYVSPSEVTGLPIRKYDTSKPYSSYIPYFNHFTKTQSVRIPEAYIVPFAYSKIIELLRINGAAMRILTDDTIITTTQYKILDFKIPSYPYEGHFPLTEITLDTIITTKTWYAGDAIVYTNCEKMPYIISGLEPLAPDSWMRWNAFDGIMNQKEYFSDYVFDHYAADFLNKHPEIQAEIAKAKAENPTISNYQLLSIIYKHTPYFEPTLRLYPIGKIEHP